MTVIYVQERECEEVLVDADEQPVRMEVGDSVYVLTCDFIGDVEVDIDFYQRVVTWTCPRCGHEHHDPDDEDPYAFDDEGFDDVF